MRTKDQWIGGVVLFVTALMLATGICFAAPPAEFTKGKWVLTQATDVKNVDWSGTICKFTSQMRKPNRILLKGYFDWHGSDGSGVREKFTGTYNIKTRQIALEGQRLDSGNNILLSVYSARLTDDGTTITDGTWNGDHVNSGTWTATWTQRIHKTRVIAHSHTRVRNRQMPRAIALAPVLPPVRTHKSVHPVHRHHSHRPKKR